MTARSQRQRPCASLVVGIVLVVLSVAGGAVIRLPAPTPWQPLDEWWAGHVIASSPLTAPSELLALALAALVGPLGWLLLVATAALLAWRRRVRQSVLLVVAPLLTALATALLKAWVSRARPEDMLVSLTSLSYPSGHSSQTAAVAAIALLTTAQARSRRWWPVAVVGVVAMMWSRTHLAVHWLSDTIGGAALGVGIALVLAWAWRRPATPEPDAQGTVLDECTATRAFG